MGGGAGRDHLRAIVPLRLASSSTKPSRAEQTGRRSVALPTMAGITGGRIALWFDWRLLLLACAALVLLVRFKVDAVYVVIGAGLTGFLLEH